VAAAVLAVIQDHVLPCRETTRRPAAGVLLFTDETFAEMASRLSRPKFDGRIVPATRRRFLADLAGVAE
jgi:hypothetical protein